MHRKRSWIRYLFLLLITLGTTECSTLKKSIILGSVAGGGTGLGVGVISGYRPYGLLISAFAFSFFGALTGFVSYGLLPRKAEDDSSAENKSNFKYSLASSVVLEKVVPYGVNPHSSRYRRVASPVTHKFRSAFATSPRNNSGGAVE